MSEGKWLKSLNDVNLQGLYLRTAQATATLPEGIVVYCIVDEGHQFRTGSIAECRSLSLTLT